MIWWNLHGERGQRLGRVHRGPLIGQGGEHWRLIGRGESSWKDALWPLGQRRGEHGQRGRAGEAGRVHRMHRTGFSPDGGGQGGQRGRGHVTPQLLGQEVSILPYYGMIMNQKIGILSRK